LSIPDSACKIVEHYSNGKVKSEKHYIGGVSYGLETVFFANGQKNYSCNKIADKIFDTVKYYDEDGNLFATRDFIDDKPYGNIIETRGDEQSVAKWFDGQTFDTVKYYQDNKLTAAIPYMEDERHGLATYYGENGELAYQLLFYKGVAIECISPKNNEHIKIENGKKIITYYANGTKSAEMTFLNGYRDGEYAEYYTNGKISRKCYYEVAEYNGSFRDYYSNGNPKEEGNYIYGDYDGAVKKYYPNGKIKEEAFYILGKKHGEQKHYNQQGNLIKKIMYYYGEVQQNQ
jgi:antitoxin component YwqK of YwqJK toxin-antitoxin module